MVRALKDLPIIDEAEVARRLKWPPLIDAVEAALIELSQGKVVQPVRQIIQLPGKNAFFAAMPAVGSAMAVKVITLFHDNAEKGLPTHQGVLLLLDAENGLPLALLDARLITEMRTAAGSAAAVRTLAPQKIDVVTIMGNGVQAGGHVEALAEVRDWKELRVWARDATRGRAFAERVGATFFADAAAAVRDADIVVCATTAREPILRGAWLKPGAFVTAIGWSGADGRELDDAAMANIVIVETVEGALAESGNVRGSGCAIFAEAGEIYSGKKVVPEGATIIYDSIGVAIADVVAAKLVYESWSAK